jgi:hypothetical protein
MALRGWGLQTVGTTASAIPVFGTTLTAAPVINPDQYTGQIGVGSNRSTAVLNLAVGFAAKFRVGDRVVLGTAAQLAQGNTVQADGGTVIGVNAGANQITVQGLQRQHVSGEFVILALPVASWTIQYLGSHTLYLAEDSSASNTANSATLIYEMSSTLNNDNYGLSNIANVLETQHLWVAGTAADTFIPSFLMV